MSPVTYKRRIPLYWSVERDLWGIDTLFLTPSLNYLLSQLLPLILQK